MYQTSIGTGYDLSNSVFSPDGRNFQVEYAVKAVENGGTAIGIRCNGGVVLAVEKIISSKLLKPGANKRIATVDRNIGVVRPPPSPFRQYHSHSQPRTGNGRSRPRRAPLRLPRARRGLLLAQALQRPYPHCSTSLASRWVRASLHLVLERAALRRHRHRRRLGL